MNDLITVRAHPHLITAACLIQCLDGILPALTMRRLRHDLPHANLADLTRLYRDGGLTSMPGLGAGGVQRIRETLAAAELIDPAERPGRRNTASAWHAVTGDCPVPCLYHLVSARPVNRLISELPHGNLNDVAALWHKGQLTDITGIGGTGIEQIRQALLNAGLIPPDRSANNNRTLV